MISSHGDLATTSSRCLSPSCLARLGACACGVVWRHDFLPRHLNIRPSVMIANDPDLAFTARHEELVSPAPPALTSQQNEIFLSLPYAIGPSRIFGVHCPHPRNRAATGSREGAPGRRGCL